MTRQKSEDCVVPRARGDPGASPLDCLTTLLKNVAAVCLEPESWLPWNYASAADRAPAESASASG